MYTGIVSYHNGRNGVYVDGRSVGGWQGGISYNEPIIIQPSGSTYYYYTQQTGMSGSTPPLFPTIPGMFVSDGGVVWINIGQMAGYDGIPGHTLNSSFNRFIGNNHTDNGLSWTVGADFDDIRIEGNSSSLAFQNQIIGASVRESETNDKPQHGVHIISGFQNSIDNVVWWGGSNLGITDLGGVQIDNSLWIAISSLQCYCSDRSCLNITNTYAVNVGTLTSYQNADSHTMTGDEFAILEDGTTNHVTFDTVVITDDRHPAYSKGISSGNLATIVRNLQETNLAAADLQNVTRESFTDTLPVGSFAWNVPTSSNGYTWSFAGSPVLQLSSSGVQVNGNVTITGTCTGCGGGSSAPVFSSPQSFAMLTTTGVQPATSMFSPATDGTYRFELYVSEKSGNAGACTEGTIAVQLGWTDPDSGISIQGTPSNNTGPTPSNSLNAIVSMAAAANKSASTIWTFRPIIFRAQAGSPVTYAINQVAATTCTTPAVFEIRPALFSEPY